MVRHSANVGNFHLHTIQKSASMEIWIGDLFKGANRIDCVCWGSLTKINSVQVM